MLNKCPRPLAGTAAAIAAMLLLVSLLWVAVSACAGNTAATPVPDATATAAPLTAPTSTIAPTPAPAPTATPEPTTEAEPTATLTPTDTPAPTPELEAMPTPSATPTPEPIATPMAVKPAPPTSGGASGREIHVDESSIWRDVYDTSDAAEQDCILGELGSQLERTLVQRINDGQRYEEILSCLDQETANSIVLYGITWAFEEGGWPLDEAEVSCLQEQLAEIDMTALVAGDPVAQGKYFEGLYSCAPGTVVAPVVEGFGLSFEDLTDREMSCLQEHMADTDWEGLFDMYSDAEWELLSGMVFCVPGPVASVLITEIGAALGIEAYDGLIEASLSQDNASCLRERGGVLSDDTAARAEFASGLLSCVPDPIIAWMMEENGLSFEDLSEAEASCMREGIAGTDWEGLLYEIGDSSVLEYLLTTLSPCAPRLVDR